MTPEKYPVPDQIARTFKVVELLAANAASGLAPGEIATALRLSPKEVTLALAHLYQLGYAEEARLPGRWRTGPRLPQLGLTALDAFDRLERESREQRQRVTRQPT